MVGFHMTEALKTFWSISNLFSLVKRIFFSIAISLCKLSFILTAGLFSIFSYNVANDFNLVILELGGLLRDSCKVLGYLFFSFFLFAQKRLASTSFF